MFIHGTKYLVLKNRRTGKVENIRSKHNYVAEDKKNEEKRLKEKFSDGDYICLSCKLG